MLFTSEEQGWLIKAIKLEEQKTVTPESVFQKFFEK